MRDYFNDTEYQAWRILSQTRNLLLKLRDREFRKHNVNRRQATTLMAIHAANGKVTAYKIARWAIVQVQTISVALNKLEKEGFIEKNEKPNSESNFILTNKGKSLVKQLLEIDPVPKAFSTLKGRESINLRATLIKVRNHALKENGIRAKLPFPPY